MFNREFEAMKMYYLQKVKKNKKLKPTLELFEAAIDVEIRDLLLREYANNVASRYARLRYLIYQEANQVIKQRRLQQGLDSDEEMPLPESLLLSHKTSLRIHFEQQRINYSLGNILTGTKLEKPIGDIFPQSAPTIPVIETKKTKDGKEGKEGKESKKDKWDEQKAANSALAKMIKFTNFSFKKKEEKDKGKKHKNKKDSSPKKGASEKFTEINISMYEVRLPMERPSMRLILDRANMQRLVTRYTLLASKMRNEEGQLLGFEPYVKGGEDLN